MSSLKFAVSKNTASCQVGFATQIIKHWAMKWLITHKMICFRELTIFVIDSHFEKQSMIVHYDTWILGHVIK